MSSRSPRGRRQRGSALLTSFCILSLLVVAGVSYIDNATTSLRTANRQAKEIQTTHLCEAGIQMELRALWRPFKAAQNFQYLDAATSGASANSPQLSVTSGISNVGLFAAGVVGVSAPDAYTRIVKIRSVGWIDLDRNGQPTSADPQQIVDVTATYQLSRSQVFDYAYFVNNYGWMNGFSPTDLIVNGDMRANGNFDFTNGSPTVNGSVYASMNEKLSTVSAGLINQAPVKWDNTTYNSMAAANSTNKADNEYRWRQVYDSTTYGAKGTSSYEKWRDLVYDSSGSIVNNRTSGAVVADATGTQSWSRTSTSNAGTRTMLDANPTSEVIMPDLSDLSYYQAMSANYVDTKQKYADGTTNPNYNQPAYIEVWDTSTSSYKRVTTNGQVTGSATLVGTSTRPIKIHGPVTISQDAVIKGTVSGQGTIYTGRNVHVVGSIIYQTKPSFRGTNPTTIDQANEKADMLALAARGSVIMGNTTQFTDSSPLNYMTPPFTKGRYDENGNWIPPFNAKDKDSTGKMRYQSVVGDSTINSLAEQISQVDAVLYTNFVGGGNVATGGSGVIFNGSIISKDEAMVVYSMPMRMNYDSRIRERSVSATPLIDIQLPRSPVMLRSSWQGRGFTYGN